MLDFLVYLAATIGFAAVSFGIVYIGTTISERISTERERRREHELRIVTILNRIADNTQPKP